MRVTKRFTFEASHYLERPELTPAANVKAYHACSGFKQAVEAFAGAAKDCGWEREPHGHSYILEVTVRGGINSDGFVIDFKELKKLVQKEIIEKCDHRLLNKVEMLQGAPITCENMLESFAKVLGPAMREHDRSVFLDRMRLWETADSFAEWEGTW